MAELSTLGSVIKTALLGQVDTNNLTDLLLTKLNQIEAQAKDDQTGIEIGALLFALADTNNLTDALLTKLNVIEAGATADLTDAEIKTLLFALNDTNNFSDALMAKLNSIDATHYGTPLQDLTALAAIAEADATDKERRYVEDEISDYFYNATATSGDVAPTDQTGGTGFWMKVAVGGETAASVKAKLLSNPDTQNFGDGEQTKLSDQPATNSDYADHIAANVLTAPQDGDFLGFGNTSAAINALKNFGVTSLNFWTNYIRPKADLRYIRAAIAATLTAGYDTTSLNDGTKTGAETYTPAFSARNVTHIINGGAFTLAPPSGAQGSMIIEITNNASAGAITTTGFDVVDGDAFTSVDTDVFVCIITITQGKSWLSVKAMQ